MRLKSNNGEKGEYLISNVTDVVGTQRVTIPIDGGVSRGKLRRVQLVLKTVNVGGATPTNMNTVLLDTDEVIPISDLDLENRIFRSDGDPVGNLTGSPETIIDEVLPEEIEFQTKGGAVGITPPDVAADPSNAGKGGFIQVVFVFNGGSGYDYDFILQLYGDALG